jgi:tetratricopeptide (TPR) repeat protein
LCTEHTWAIAHRGWTYRLIGRYQEALADFDRAIALDEKYSWAIASRGRTYRLMGRYQEALADFDRAIALDEKLAWVIANRGEAYRLMKRYQEALADFDRAIALDEKDAWYRYCRAQAYMLIGQIKAFESDIQAAIELGQATLRSTPEDCQSGFNLALYYLAAGNITETEFQYTHFASVCSSLAQLQEAMDDLTDFLTIQPSNEPAQYTRTQLQTRVAELQQSPTE